MMPKAYRKDRTENIPRIPEITQLCTECLEDKGIKVTLEIYNEKSKVLYCPECGQLYDFGDTRPGTGPKEVKLPEGIKL